MKYYEASEVVLRNNILCAVIKSLLNNPIFNTKLQQVGYTHLTKGVIRFRFDVSSVRDILNLGIYFSPGLLRDVTTSRALISMAVQSEIQNKIMQQLQ